MALHPATAAVLYPSPSLIDSGIEPIFRTPTSIVAVLSDIEALVIHLGGRGIRACGA